MVKANSKSHKPWVTPDLLELIRQKTDLYREYKSSRSQEDWKIYTNCKNRLTSELRKAEREYYETISDTCKSPDASKLLCHFREVLTVLQSLQVNKAPGPDGIPNRLLKEAAPEICDSLRCLFNNSLATGLFPTEWKQSNLTPVYKKGDKNDPFNYRPISLLPTVAKVMERLVHNHLYSYLEENNLLHSHQSGFRKGHHCFADDTSLYNSAKTVQEVAATTNTDLQLVSTWFLDWGLSLHPDKCKVVCIKSDRNNVQLPPIYLLGKIVEQVPFYSHLGVTIHQSLRWTEHVQVVTGKSRKLLGLLRKVSGKLGRQALETAYFALVRPKLEYASALLGDLASSASRLLEQVQYQAGLLVTGAMKGTPKSNLLQELEWDTLATRRQLNSLTIMYNMMNGRVPPHLQLLTPSTRGAQSTTRLQLRLT
ncbi:uncharacterized protein LOC144887771 [Branchiostoma floridae x Branchiostoma japonicum]